MFNSLFEIVFITYIDYNLLVNRPDQILYLIANPPNILILINIKNSIRQVTILKPV